VNLVETSCNTNDSDDKLASSHTESSPNEKSTATDPLHSVERDGCEDCVDKVEDQGDDKGVANSAGGLEEGCGVIEDEVDTSPEELLAVKSADSSK
jgi:hypothetical protein